MILRMVRIACFSIAALAIGFFGLSLFFSDLGTGESLSSRFVTAAILYFVVGFIIGFFNPGIWMLAGLVAWGGVVLGLLGLTRAGDASLSFLMVTLSIGPALLGGFLASFTAKKLSHRKSS